jgi:hypothetical protein
VNLANVIDFGAILLYRAMFLHRTWPTPELYRYLRTNEVEVGHCLNLLDGAIDLQSCTFPEFPNEPCLILPVLDSDGQTPVDIAGVSIQDPHRFGTMLGKGSLLGLDQVDNPATYARGPLKLVRTPLAWLQAGIEGCAPAYFPWLVRPLLDAAQGPSP